MPLNDVSIETIRILHLVIELEMKEKIRLFFNLITTWSACANWANNFLFPKMHELAKIGDVVAKEMLFQALIASWNFRFTKRAFVNSIFVILINVRHYCDLLFKRKF